ncbi:MAG TPA: hypothetical protein VMW47_12235 [Verrucomicrobiae bacterium]|nr:hypothetical protein [Verrucomicrobiae bacterium]
MSQATTRFVGTVTELAPVAARVRDEGSMTRATRQIRLAMAAHAHRAEARRWRRRGIQAIDRALDHLEELHSADVAPGHAYCQQMVDDIIAATGMDAPARVRRASSSYHLHSALLLWQERVMEALIPARQRLYPDLDPEVDEVGLPGRPRREPTAPRRARLD